MGSHILRIKNVSDTEKGHYYFRVLDHEDKQVLRSEVYNSKAGRDNGVRSVRENANDKSKYDKLESENGKYYFNLKAGNGQIIGTSKLFDSEVDRDTMIDLMFDFIRSGMLVSKK